jgi:lipopolysaccharide export system permease protein
LETAVSAQMILIVDRYLAFQVFVGLCIATAVLLPLFSFLDLLDQLNDVGNWSYQVKDAFFYTALLMPRRFIQLAPFIALLGTVIALGRLAKNLELTALQIAGISPVRVSMAPLVVGFILLIFIAVLEQFVAPQLQQKAISHRATAFEGFTQLGKNLGIWTRDERNILRIGEMITAKKAANVEVLHFDDNGSLLTYTHAKYADITDDNLWELSEVISKTFNETEEKIESISTSSMQWESFVNPTDISTLTKSPDSLSPIDLFHHVRFLKSTGQEADAYELALWRKVGGAFITIAMMLLSIPFVFGSSRTGFSNKLVLAVMVGISVHLLDQIIANAGLLLHFPPALTALFPGLALILVANLWLRKIP